MAYPLDGIRVVESGDSLAVAFAGRLLRGLGAEVTISRTSPAFSAHPAAVTLQRYLDSGKRTDTAAAPEGAHVWLDGRPLSDIRADRERSERLQDQGLVHVAVTPFGLEGPWAERRGTGIVAGALGGFLHLCGDENGPPLKNGGYILEFQAGLFAVLGALAGVFKAEAGRGGTLVDVSLLESVIAFQERADFAWTHQGRDWRRTRRHEVAHPFTIFPCADGFVSIALGTARHWQNFSVLIGRPEWADDMDLMLNRHARADEVDAALVPWLAERTAAEVVERFQEMFIPCGPVLTASQVLADAHLQERRFFRSLEFPGGQRFRVPGPPFRSDYPWALDEVETPAEAAS